MFNQVWCSLAAVIALGPPLAIDGASPGPSGGGAGTGPSGGDGGTLLIMMFAFLAFIIIWSLMSSRREKKKRESMLGSLRKHDQVQTIGGVIGSVVDIKKETVVLKVDESSNVRMTFSRSAIQQVLSGSRDSEGRNPEAEQTSEQGDGL